MQEVKFYLNGLPTTCLVRANEYLLETLRRLGIHSVKNGCNESTCGACCVLVDDKPVLSCSILTASINNKHVTTVEGLHEEAKKVYDCFSSEGADQCGFCNAAYTLVLYSLKKENPNPTEEEMKSYLIGQLCRCTGYAAQIKAAAKYIKMEDK